jgi:hypothetical protein
MRQPMLSQHAEGAAPSDSNGPPRGLVALGDAISSFNPVYGQGMSIAALQPSHYVRLSPQVRTAYPSGTTRPTLDR